MLGFTSIKLAAFSVISLFTCLPPPNREKYLCDDLIAKETENLQYELVKSYIHSTYSPFYQLPPLDEMFYELQLNLTQKDFKYTSETDLEADQGVFYLLAKGFQDKLEKAAKKAFFYLNNQNLTKSSSLDFDRNYDINVMSLLNYQASLDKKLFPHTHYHDSPRVYRFSHTLDPKLFPPVPGTIWKVGEENFLVTKWFTSRNGAETIKGFYINKTKSEPKDLLKKGYVYLGENIETKDVLRDRLLTKDLKKHDKYAHRIRRKHLTQIINTDKRSTWFSYLPATFPKKDMVALYKYPCYDIMQEQNYHFSNKIHRVWHSSPLGFQGMRIFSAINIFPKREEEKTCFPFEEKNTICGPLKQCSSSETLT